MSVTQIRDSQNFNLKQFNLDFEEELKRKNELRAEREEGTLNNLNSTISDTNVLNMSIADMLIGIKDTWFGLMDDLLAMRFEVATVTKNNRLFFVGLSVIICVVLVYIINYLSNLGDSHHKNEKIIKIYHINQHN